MNTVLVLRTCKADMTSYNGTFKWPSEGPVVCPDWNPVAECGQGLHGLLWGDGDGRLLNWSADAKWLVIEVQEKEIVDLSSKVKFPRGNVVFCGDQYEATQYLAEHGGRGRAIAGYTAVAGDGGKATCGDYGKAMVGDHGTATCGNSGTATAGDEGKATAGDHGWAMVGDHGKATCGDGGTAMAGDGGKATAGDEGTATAGYGGKATAGAYGTAMAGDGGTLILSWWDSKNGRYRIVVGYVGENGILPNEPYKLDDNGGFVRAQGSAE